MKSNRHKADTELVRQQNRSLVLEALRHHGTLASIELGEKTRLSPATISAITNDMLSERLIETDMAETEKHRNAKRGRPQVKLKLSASAAVVLAIRVTHNLITLLLADFCGQIRARAHVSIETSTISAHGFEEKLVESVATFLEKQGIKPAHVTLATVACQGSVDAVKGELIWSPAFSARNIAIAAPLSTALGLPSLVANDTNAIAHFLHVDNPGLSDSFAILYLGSGIGLGLYINNTLLEGSNGSASEFGHMLWQRHGALCRCGRQGCIEAYAADFGILRSARAGFETTKPKDITPSNAEMAALADQARAGDRQIRQAFEQAGTAIGDGLSNLIMLINPRHILFTGPGTSHFDLLRPAIEAALAHAAINQAPVDMTVIDDKRDLIEAGLLALAYSRLDRDVFAKRISVEEVATRQTLLVR